MSTVTTPKPQAASRSRSQIIVLFIALIVFIMLLFANFAYLNTQSTYDKQYIGHAGELRVLSQRIAKNATEAATGKAEAFPLLKEARRDFEERWGFLTKGNEASGLPDEFAQIGVSTLIPHSQQIDSLNLAIAAGIGMYAFTRK